MFFPIRRYLYKYTTYVLGVSAAYISKKITHYLYCQKRPSAVLLEELRTIELENYCEWQGKGYKVNDFKEFWNNMPVFSWRMSSHLVLQPSPIKRQTSEQLYVSQPPIEIILCIYACFVLIYCNLALNVLVPHVVQIRRCLLSNYRQLEMCISVMFI